MKRVILIVVILAGFCGNANAFDEWSDADIWREVAVVGLLAADWNQTHHIAVNSHIETNITVEHPYDANPTYTVTTTTTTPPLYRDEINPALGVHPSPADVDKYFAINIAIHLVVTHVLPAEYRPYWQYLYIINEAGFVGHNIGLGISMGF